MDAKLAYITTIVVAVGFFVVAYFTMPSFAQQTQGFYSQENASMIAADLNSFTFRMYGALGNASSGNLTNVFFSPFSVFTVMGMASEGARGSTLAGMQEALGLSNDSNANRYGFESLLYGLTSHNADYQLSIADSAWIEKSFPIIQNFTDTLSAYYYAGARGADFVNNPVGERTIINSWVANRTDNRIQDLLPIGSVDSSTRLVLVNAIYFSGLWAQQFNAKDTVIEPFYINSSTELNVSMMHLEAKNASYYSNSTLQALLLDYKGDNVSMIVLLPTSNSTVDQLQSSLSSGVFNTIRSKLSIRSEILVSLPKFNMTASYEMGGALKSLGMQDAFAPGADFSGISANQSLYISSVVQKAFVEVNEQGTEAAAATGTVMTTAVLAPIFNADRPFIFFIVDNNTGAILFMGRVVSPQP